MGCEVALRWRKKTCGRCRQGERQDHLLKNINMQHAFLTYLPVVALAASSVVALWQCQRAWRSTSELRPPVYSPLPAPAPHVSIILPVRNEAAHIDACLASLAALDYPDFSIIVIDDGSTDT